MSASRIENDAMRLLGAFYDMSGGKLNESVAVGGPDASENGAADAVGFDAAQRDVALRYLLDRDYVRAADDGSGYCLTVSGSDRAREARSPAQPASQEEERSGMSDKTQRRLLTVFSTVIALAVSQPLTNYIGEQIPERRGIRDDALEAALQGLVRAVSIFLASMLVRQVVLRRR